MKKRLKSLSIFFASALTFALAACGGSSNKGSGDPNDGQNDIEDKTQTCASVDEAVSAVKDGLTTDQKNSILPGSCVTDTYTISASGNYYFTGVLSNVITVAKNSGNVHIFLEDIELSLAGSSLIASIRVSSVL